MAINILFMGSCTSKRIKGSNTRNLSYVTSSRIIQSMPISDEEQLQLLYKMKYEKAPVVNLTSNKLFINRMSRVKNIIQSTD